MPHGKTRFKESPLEGEGAPDEKGDQALPPQGPYVRRLFRQNTLPVDPVPGKIAPEVGALREPPGFPIPGFGDLEEGTGPRVSLAKKQEVEGPVPGQDDQVCLSALTSSQEPTGELQENVAPLGSQCVVVIVGT